jgi:DNA polymerase III alpha subunit
MDIDIDVESNFKCKKIFPNAINASMVEGAELKKHNVGVYFQNIPKDEKTNLAAIPYKKAHDFGYFKVDLIHLKLLDSFENKTQLREYMYREPDWSLFEYETVVKQLFHLSKSFDVVKKIKPKSVMELADCLALIRPGKRKLINSYIKDKDAVREKLYKKEKASDLRKSHALPYAYLIIAQLNLIQEQHETK